MNNKGDEKQTNSNSLAAVATGIVIGAGVAAAGAVILNDKKNREKVKNAVKDVKKQVSGYIEDAQKKAIEEKGKRIDKVTEGKEELKKKAEASINSAQGTLEEAKKSL